MATVGFSAAGMANEPVNSLRKLWGIIRFPSLTRQPNRDGGRGTRPASARKPAPGRLDGIGQLVPPDKPPRPCGHCPRRFIRLGMLAKRVNGPSRGVAVQRLEAEGRSGGAFSAKIRAKRPRTKQGLTVDKAAKRLEIFRSFLKHVHERLQLEFGFSLWDGSRVPAAFPADGMQLAFGDEGAVAALLRKPRITTLANLWAAKRIDIVNGTLFDIVDKRPEMRTREIRKVFSKIWRPGPP